MAAGDVTVAHIPNDETGATTATLANTQLSFAVTNAVYYAFRFYVAWRSASATVGLKIALTTPTFTIFSARARMITAADGTSAEWQGDITSSGDSVICTNTAVINTDFLCVIEGNILPSATGTLMVQYAAETTGSTVTMRQGSCGELVEV